MLKTAFIFQYHNHSKGFVNFLNQNYADRGYDKYLLMSSDNPNEPYEGINELRYRNSAEETNHIVEICKTHDVVYLVSSFFSPIVKIRLSILYNSILRKLVWIEWGYDLYKSDNPKISIRVKSWFKNNVKKVFETKIPVFVAIHPADLPVYDEVIGGSAVKFSIPYAFAPSTSYDNLYESDFISYSDILKAERDIVIQVGNRADRPLNHLAILDKLSVYKDYPIKILIPLSYGNKDYASIVKKKAEDLFGSKAWCLMDYIAYTEYTKILDTVDILIIDSNRQIALGNIHPILYRKKKLFLSPKSPLYKYYLSNDIKVYSIDNLGVWSFEELCSDDDLSKGRDYIINYRKKNGFFKSIDEIKNISEIGDAIFEAIKEYITV